MLMLITLPGVDVENRGRSEKSFDCELPTLQNKILKTM